MNFHTKKLVGSFLPNIPRKKLFFFHLKSSEVKDENTFQCLMIQFLYKQIFFPPRTMTHSIWMQCRLISSPFFTESLKKLTFYDYFSESLSLCIHRQTYLLSSKSDIEFAIGIFWLAVNYRCWVWVSPTLMTVQCDAANCMKIKLQILTQSSASSCCVIEGGRRGWDVKSMSRS